MLGIITAMDVELELITAAMKIEEEVTVGGLTFKKGTLGKTEAVAVICGIGKVAAAMTAQILISVFGVTEIVNTGIAGSVSPDLHQGEVVIAKDFVQHDVDTSPLGDPIGLVSGINRIDFPCDEALRKVLFTAAEKSGKAKVREGRIATGDQFIANRDKAKWIADTFGAISCEMEGGAIAHVCFVAGVPFAAVRCISDDAGDGMTYQELRTYTAHISSDIILSAFMAEGE